MTADHRFVADVPDLDEPVLVVMLTGWIDASGAAAAAMSALDAECNTTRLVEFDDDTFIDFRARRPLLELRDGVNTRLVWSSPQLRVGRDPQGHDVLLLTGPEPDMAWHRFASLVGDLAGRLGVVRMAALGAYPFAAPHTRSPRVTATSPSSDLLATLPFRLSSVDVPAGMSAALEWELHERGIPSVGIWAQVPHYIASMSYAAASLAVLDGLATVTGISINADDLRREAEVQRQRLDQLVEANEEHQAMVTQFERMYDATEEATDGTPGRGDGALELRSGDELAAEVERFLREQGKS
jgi:proteasome assembly chaperone (PAC2) family protein